MVVDLQKANFWKRVAAWLFDGILLCVLAVGCGTLLAEVLHYDTHAENLQAAYDKYETQYGVVFEMTAEEYAAMSEEAQKNYDAAYGALLTDQMAVTAYNKVMNQSLLIITFSILAAILVLEFAVPLWIGNGQTLGKKIFALGLIRTDPGGAGQVHCGNHDPGVYYDYGILRQYGHRRYHGADGHRGDPADPADRYPKQFPDPRSGGGYGCGGYRQPDNFPGYGGTDRRD